MPNVDDLIEGIKKITSEGKESEVYFRTLNFTYAYRSV